MNTKLNRYSTLIATGVVALVGLFTARGAEAVVVNHTGLQNQLNAIQSQLEQIPPVWSQDLPAAERFELVLGGAAVLDKETGLVWEQAPDTSRFVIWADAQLHCNARFVGGRKGWGLPTVQQLASLLDPIQSLPALPAGHPFSIVLQSGAFWSATAGAEDPSRAWAVGIGGAGVGRQLKASTFFVWCVRGGPGPDAQ